MRPPTPSTVRTAPIRLGATRCTLRAKKPDRSFRWEAIASLTGAPCRWRRPYRDDARRLSNPSSFGISQQSLRAGCSRRLQEPSQHSEEHIMSIKTVNRLTRRAVALTTALGALALSTRALAGECPTDKRGKDVMRP